MSNINDRFKEVVEKMVGKDSTVGVPLIDPKDVKNGKNHLDTLMRKFIIDNKISKEVCDEKFRQYSDETDYIPAAALANKKGNLLKTIKTGRITFRKFIEMTCGILGFKLLNISITFQKPNGQTYKVNLED